MQRAYNPVHWGYTANNPQKAYQAACPTLMEYDSAYGHGEAANWIDIQVSALFGASSKADKTLADSIGISQSYISRLEKRIIKRLRREIESVV